MSQWIQVLENRQLLTATATVLTSDAAAVNTQISALKTTLASSKSSAKSIQTVLSNDLKSAATKANRASNQKLLAAILRTESSQYAVVFRAENTLITNATSLAKRALADGKALLVHPTKSSNQTKVNKDIVALNTIIPAKVLALQTALASALTAVNNALANVATANPSLATVVQSDELTLAAQTNAISTASAGIGTTSTKFAIDLGNQTAPTVTLTGLTFFRGDASGNNQNSSGSVIDFGAWTSGLDVQNVPGNYGGELFISKVPNPTPADFLSPAALSLSLSAGDNKFYFWADGDDTRGGSSSFGLNVFLNSSSGTTPTLSGYSVPGTGQTLLADSAAVTPSLNFIVTPGAGKLSASVGTSGTVTLSAFQIQGVSGQGSTVDIVNSTNTVPFTPPAHADGVFDTYGTFTITVS